MTENELLEGYIPPSIATDTLVIKNENNEEIQDMAFARDSENISHVSINVPMDRKRKIGRISESDNNTPVLVDQVNIYIYKFSPLLIIH